MKLLTFTKDGARRVGLFKDGRILDLPEAYMTVYDTLEAPDFLYDMRRLIALGEPALEMARRLEAAWWSLPSSQRRGAACLSCLGRVAW